MADISQIKLPNGDTYNLVDETSGYTSNVGTITKIKTTAGTHNTIDISSGAATFNVPTTAAHVGINFGYTTNGNNRAVLQDSNGNLYVTQKDDNTTYSSKAAANGGTDVSLVTTGEKYTWNSKTSNVGTVTSVAATGSGGITISGSPITSTGTLTIGLNLSTAINGLSEGASPAQLNDYAVVQYAGGGTTTTTYHRRKLTNLIVGKAVADQNGDTIHTTYLKLTGGNVTGPVSFGDSVSIDDLTAGQLVVNGGASIVNNLQVNTINGVTVGSSPKFTDNNSFKSFYGTCDTAAATAAKVITLSVTTGWQLVAGTVVGVKFTNTNTAQNPTLNINGTGAKNIYVNNATITTSNLWYAGEAGRIHFYMYDGSQWIFMGHSYDWNSDLKVTQTNSTTNADYRILLSANANDTTETNTSFKNTNLRYNPSTGTLKIKGFDSISSNFKSINCDVSKSEVTAQNSSLTTSSADTDWFQALVKAICVKYPNITNTVFRGMVSPNSHRYYEIFIYDTSTIDSTTKLPQHSFGQALVYGGGFTKFGTDGYVWRFGNVDTNTNTTYSAGTGLSLSSTTFNHSNSVTAQTTQAVYPIKIDAQGHISAYGSAQTILTIGTGASNAAAGNHTHSYLPLSGGTLSGDLLFSDSGTATRQVRGIAGANDYWRIAGGATASNAGWMEIATADDGNEPIYVRQYTGAYATIARTLTLLDASGNTSLPGRLTTTDPINQIITGSGTTASDKGADVSPRYFPAKWVFNTGQTATNGDIITIKIPVAGHSYGVFLSINNGTNYHPVVAGNGTGRLTTHYASGTPIQLIFDSSGSAADMFALNGADARATVTGGVWRVLNYYVDGNTYTQALCTTAAATAAKAASMSYYVATANRYVMVNMYYANSSATALTLNINGTGAKPIYINGGASSTSNYTLPAGSYLVFYDGTNYHFRTDGYTTAKHYNEAPASEVTRYPLTTSVTGVGLSDIINTNTRYWIKKGTTSVVGYNYLGLGNATASGTDNNSQGYLRLYGQNTGYSNLTYANSTSNVTNTLPATTGTLLNTAGGQQINNITTLYREGTTANNYPAGLKFSVKDTTTNQTYSSAYIYAYQDHGSTTCGTNMVIHSGGGMFLGSGEAPANHYSAKGASYTGEDTFITADGTMYIQSNAGTIANRLGFYLNSSHQIIPCKAETATNNVGSIGTSSYKWNAMYATTFYGALSGNATTATTASVVSYTTTAPTAANSSGLKFAVLTSDPATKYNGWVYLIKG